MLEVLRSKHPEARLSLYASLNSYIDLPPALVTLDITDDAMMEVDLWLSIRAGPRGTDEVRLQH